MSKPNEDRDVYYIPPNFLTSGRLFGGMIRARNAIEACVLVLLTGVPIIKLPFSLTTRIIILCLVSLPLGIFGVIGFEGDSLSEFAVNWVRWLIHRRTLYRSDTPVPEAPEKPMKAVSGMSAPKPPEQLGIKIKEKPKKRKKRKPVKKPHKASKHKSSVAKKKQPLHAEDFIPVRDIRNGITIYYRAKWHSEFNEAGTEKGLFHLFSADGETVECDFMHKGGSNTYYWADQFGAVALSLEGSGKMWFLLPDDGVAMDDLLADEQTMEFLNSNGNWENSKHLIVNMSVPKFDVVSDLDLRDGLNALGITGVFDATVADFSPMTSKVAEIFLSKADHAARVAIDEEGVTAAAYTVMMMAGAAAPPEEEMDFVLDRPFLFAITGADGLPLFVGVVNRP